MSINVGDGVGLEVADAINWSVLMMPGVSATVGVGVFVRVLVGKSVSVGVGVKV